MNIPASDLVAAVDSSRLAEGLDAAQAAVLAGLVSLQRFEPRQVLAAEGSVDDRLYVVVEGQLSVARNLGTPEEAVLVLLGPGDFAHELSFLDGTPRYATLLATTAASVLVLPREQLESLIDTHPRILYAVMRNIVRVVHRVQTRLAVQASELTNYVVKQHGRY